MKKILLLIVFAAAASLLSAQDMCSFMYHDKVGHHINMNNPMQQRDGDFVINTYIFEDVGGNNAIPLGNMLYKLSPTTLTFTDSLFLVDTAQRTYFLARDPLGEGNIKAVFEYHEDCDSTFLRIRHFTDNDLHTNPEEDIVTPVCEGAALGGSTFLDCHGDLIMKYYIERSNVIRDEYVARFAPNGTLKQQVLFEENVFETVRLHVLKETPLQYYQFKDAPDDNLSIIVVDSLFQKNTVILNKILRSESINQYATEYEYLNLNDYSQVEVLPVGGDDVLVAARYVYDTNFDPLHAKHGVAVAKFDLRTMQLKDYVVFGVSTSTYNRKSCMGLKMMTDGTVYFAYMKPYEPKINIVKMDTDLNVEWNRLVKTSNIILYSGLGYSSLFEDGQGNEKGIAWSWYASKEGNDRIGLAHFFLNHDGTLGTNDAGIEVRPYTYFPNPAQDRLHLQYSPDVKPAQVELYDLQGRLVRTQSQGLESINLQGLAPGQYLMKVTMEDGKTYSDKVMKE